jgi:hypothetical protein
MTSVRTSLLSIAILGVGCGDAGSTDVEGSTGDETSGTTIPTTSSTTSSTSSTTSTGSSTTTDETGSTGEVTCFEPLVACGGECVDPRVDPAFCGARGDCQGDDAGETCSASGYCDAGDCVETCDNCGFEDGDLSGWDVIDVSDPFLPVGAVMAGVTSYDGLFLSEPTEGVFALVHGFDGDGATGANGDAVEVGQEVHVSELGAQLEFDYRLGWDTTFGATKARLFRVRIDDPEGGPPLGVYMVDNVPPNNATPDAGARSASIDLSAFAGETVRIVLVFTIPEDFTGPGMAQVDNVRLAYLPQG